MESTTEGARPAGVTERVLKGLGKKAGQIFRKASPRGQEIVPADEIDTRAVCIAIASVLKHSEVFSKPEEEKLKTFSTIDLMAELGHNNIINDPKLNEQFRRGREKVRLVIDRLIEDDVLEDIVLDEPDESGEIIRYQLKGDESGWVDKSYDKVIQIAEGKLTLDKAA